MSDDKTQKLLLGGIKAARAGDTELARRAFTQVLRLDPDNEAAWLGMATVTDDPDDKMRILTKILYTNPDNKQAQEAIQRLKEAQDIEAAEQAEQTSGDEDVFDVDAELDLDNVDLDSVSSNAFVGDIDDDAVVSSPFAYDASDDIGEPSLEDLGVPPMPNEAESTGVSASYLDDFELPPLPSEAETDDTQPSALPSLSDTDSKDDTAVFDVSDGIDDVFEADAPRIVLRTSQEVFESMPLAPQRGQGGVPIAEPTKIGEATAAAKARLQSYLEDSLEEYAEIIWEEKRRGKAGQREWASFLLASTSATLGVLAILGVGFVFAILNNPTAVRVLFAPTWTPSATPTATHTATPGVTNTPSPTPRNTSTPIPTIRPTITPANPIIGALPTATDIADTFRSNLRANLDVEVENAALLIEQGELQEAFNILQEERTRTVGGNFFPTYFLVDLFIQQNQPNQAENAIEEWRDNLNQTDNADLWLSLVNISEARIALQRAENNDGTSDEDVEARDELIESARELLTQVIEENLDPDNPEVYLLLAESYLLTNERDDAIRILTDAIESASQQQLYSSATLRLRRAQLYRENRDYDEALLDLELLLTINPYNEAILIEQVETALQGRLTGLPVLYAQEYLYYYPGSVNGYYYLGQARQQENKDDLAFTAYARGLQGNEDDPAYVDILVARGELYTERGDLDAAEDDLSQALELGQNAPRVRAARMNAAFVSGNYDVAFRDSQQLIGRDVVSDGELRLIQGQILIERDEDYARALTTLERALNIDGLPTNLRPLAAEYIARAQLGTGNLEAALASIETAIAAEETTARYYVRGQIYAEQGELELALADYEFVLTWGSLYGLPYLEDVQREYDALLRRVGNR